MMKLNALIILFLFLTMSSYAQLNQIEAISGFHKSSLSHFSSLPASVKSGINISTFAFFQKYHRPQEEYLDEAGVQLSVLKQITSHLSVGPTFYYNSFAGMMEKLSISYLKTDPNFMVMFSPSAGYSHKENAIMSELYFQLRYQLRLSGKWQLITYFQGLTNWLNIRSDIHLQSHNRSFQYFRLGLSESNNWQFGLAIDLDQYGPGPIQENTSGIFLRKVFIHN